MFDALTNLINQLRAIQAETEYIEFKKNNDKPELIGEYISALSNGACISGVSKSYLIYGIDDQTHDIVGTDIHPRNTRIGNEELENWLLRLLDPRIGVTIHEAYIEDKRVVLFEIDAAVRRPVRFKGTAFVRVGSYKKPLSQFPEKERQIWLSGQSSAFEDDIARRSRTIQEVLHSLDYSAYFRMLDLPIPTDPAQIIDKLLQEGFVRATATGYDITNLGAILFATNLADFPGLRRKAVRVIIYKDNSRRSAQKEQVGGKGYAAGFEGMIRFIKDQVPTSETIVNGIRKQTGAYPDILIRELAANALVHQDFTQSGTGVMIELFPNRIEFTNPGRPLIDILRFIDHSPTSRNEQLASALRRLGICEERGSGIDKVVHAVEEFGLPPLQLTEESVYFRATVYSRKAFKDMDRKERIMAGYQHACLRYIEGNSMSNQSLRERFRIEEKNYPMVSRVISDALEERLIKEADPLNKSKKLVRYVPFWA